MATQPTHTIKRLNIERIHNDAYTMFKHHINGIVFETQWFYDPENTLQV